MDSWREHEKALPIGTKMPKPPMGALYIALLPEGKGLKPYTSDGALDEDDWDAIDTAARRYFAWDASLQQQLEQS